MMICGVAMRRSIMRSYTAFVDWGRGRKIEEELDEICRSHRDDRSDFKDTQKHTVDEDSKTHTKYLRVYLPCCVHLLHIFGSYVLTYTCKTHRHVVNIPGKCQDSPPSPPA